MFDFKDDRLISSSNFKYVLVTDSTSFKSLTCSPSKSIVTCKSRSFNFLVLEIASLISLPATYLSETIFTIFLGKIGIVLIIILFTKLI